MIYTLVGSLERSDAMGKRINIMIDEDTWRVLGKIPAGCPQPGSE